MNKKFLSFTLILSTMSLSTVFLGQKPANAWMDICNQSGETLSLSFGYKEGPWVSEGWWTINSGGCARVYPHELWRRNRYYYFYAKNQNGTRRWGSDGSHSFCITNYKFSLNQDDTVSSQCGGDIKARGMNCSGFTCGPSEWVVLARRTYWQKFGQIDIGGGKVQNYKFTLN